MAISGADAQTPKGSGGRRSIIRRPSTKVLVVLLVIILLALVPTVLSTLKKTPRNMVGISYGGGPFESAHFQRIVHAR